jgi:hypothetical protein
MAAFKVVSPFNLILTLTPFLWDMTNSDAKNRTRRRVFHSAVGHSAAMAKTFILAKFTTYV